MKKYTIEIREDLQRLVSVEAASPEEALEKVKAEYYSGLHILDSRDCVDHQIDIYPAIYSADT